MPTPLKFEGEYSHAAMVERAVRNARPRDTGKHARWVAVMDTLGYGSTTSTQLCQHFGLDPHEEIDGPRCDVCEHGIVRSLGRDNDEIVTDCPICTPKG